MNISVQMVKRSFGGYETDRYMIDAYRDPEEETIVLEINYDYEEEDPSLPEVEMGEQDGGIFEIDVAAASWLADVLRRLCDEQTENSGTSWLKFDKQTGEFKTGDN